MESVSSEKKWLRADNDQRILDPLQSVRKYIRSYILFESLALVLILAFVWFWAGLLIDYIPFAALSFDWLESLNGIDPGVHASRWIRGMILLVVVVWVGYYLFSRLFNRIFKEFSDDSIAMVLEERFPDLLQERLISAIQLSDPKIAEKYNFSKDMVQKTIQEAHDRMGKLPVAQVFDWGRLLKLWVWVAVVTFGVFLLVGAGAFGIKLLRGQPISLSRYAWNFHHTAAIFSDRNLFLQDTYYPRDNYLQVIRFQDQGHPGEMKIPLEDNRPDLTVRALEWVVSDPKERGGWRALKVSEIAQFVPSATALLGQINLPADFGSWSFDADDLDESLPSGVVPETWNGKSNTDIMELIHASKYPDDIKKAAFDSMDWKNWTVDKLFLQWEKIGEDLKYQIKEKYDTIDQAIAQLKSDMIDLEATGQNQRAFRRLQVPEQIRAVFRGEKKKVEDNGRKKGDRKFTVELKNLEETANVVVRGGDYSTQSLKLSLVGPPRVSALLLDKWEPAYLYHRVSGSQLQLVGKRHHFRDLDVSYSKEIPIALGGDVLLRGAFEKNRPIRAKGFTLFALPDLNVEDEKKEKWELPKGGVRIENTPGELDNVEGLVLSADRQNFRFLAKKVDRKLAFGLEYYDADNVRGQMVIRIRPVADEPPQFDTINENAKNIEPAVVLRKPKAKGENKTGSIVGEGLLITPMAAIPFNCNKLADKQGLAEVLWTYEVEPVRFELTGKAEDLKSKSSRFLLRGEEGPRRASLVLSNLQFSPQLGMGNLFSPFYTQLSGQILESDMNRKDNFSVERKRPLNSFFEKMQALPETPPDQIDVKLEQTLPEKSPHVTNFIMKRDEFDVRDLLPELRVKDKTEVQLHYQLKVTMELVDTNVETGPGRTRPRSVYTFLIVSENELLAQIGQEEEDLRTILDNQYSRLNDAKVKLVDSISKLSQVSPDLGFIGIRASDIRKTLLGSAEETRKVTQAYGRILEEMRVNRLSTERVSTVERRIAKPLENLVKTELREDEKTDPSFGNFSLTEDAISLFHEGIEKDIEESKSDDRNRDKHLAGARQSLQRMESLLQQLSQILSAMDDGIDFAQTIEKGLIIERNQRMSAERLAGFQKAWEEIFFDFLSAPKK